jgi:hypothetical protein
VLVTYAFESSPVAQATWCLPAAQERILRMGHGPLKMDLSTSIADDPSLYVVAYPNVPTAMATFSSKVAATFQAHSYSPNPLF